RLLAALPDDQCRDIARWRMEGYNRQEIAERLDCSTRTVAYRLEYIRKIWEKMES
ncbi:MAG: LuxR C-terminal-related transcriptional regulator, partial [Thermoleophilia bacterium]|nr:LuxR C-terminal-related transcriptional regulator [Thermoleophilia bacterium]